MCGRFTQRAGSKRIAREFKVTEVPAVEARYNIAPAQDVLAVYEPGDGREATFYKWGLIPSWAKDASMGTKLINARSETVAEKPSFREAFKRRRCIIPADGFYEWQRTGGEEAALLLPDERRETVRLRGAVGAVGRAGRQGHQLVHDSDDGG
jgi:putative SOS response-associated peptidase YedK